MRANLYSSIILNLMGTYKLCSFSTRFVFYILRNQIQLFNDARNSISHTELVGVSLIWSREPTMCEEIIIQSSVKYMGVYSHSHHPFQHWWILIRAIQLRSLIAMWLCDSVIAVCIMQYLLLHTVTLTPLIVFTNLHNIHTMFLLEYISCLPCFCLRVWNK